MPKTTTNNKNKFVVKPGANNNNHNNDNNKNIKSKNNALNTLSTVSVLPLVILEDGYNTDYIYSMITALFYIPTDGTNRIINGDVHDVNAYYVQEFIKRKFIYPIHRSASIESCVINKFRLFMYNCGWLKNDYKHILDKGKLDDFYLFLMKMMDQSIKFTIVDANDNNTRDIPFEMIKISDNHIAQKTNDDNSQTKLEESLDESLEKSNVVNLSTIIRKWTKDEILGQNISYKFENIPYIIPVYIDITDPKTRLNKKYINIMEGLNFPDNGDKIQKMLIWEFHSMICQNDSGNYYSVVLDHDDNLMGFSDKKIPSNWKIDVTNVDIVKKIMLEVKLVFYKLQ
jgi:hypothetical protein